METKKLLRIVVLAFIVSACTFHSNPRDGYFVVNRINRQGGQCEYFADDNVKGHSTNAFFSARIYAPCGKFQIGDTIRFVNYGN